MKKVIILNLLIFNFFISKAQPHCAPDYFSSPLDIPLTIAGSFGELRTDHFHAGVDFKTEGVIGKNILSVADGYVSRVKISLWGYGKSVYVTHSNGLVSVYAHLNSMSKKIDDFVSQAQYDTKTYEIDVFPSPGQIPVKKGEIIALSGNTGSSGGPHLHFEIRDEITEHALNPFLFYFKIKDNTTPKIIQLYCYPLDEKSNVNGKTSRIGLEVAGSNGQFKLAENQTINANGNVGFAIETNDFTDLSSNKCGVYSIELLDNDKRIFYFEMNDISFDETRYINSHMDYILNETKNKKIHKSFLEPNNQLNIYKDVVKNGIINFINDSTHNLKYIVKDYFGNSAVFPFTVKGTKVIEPVKTESVNSDIAQVMPYNKENYFQRDDIMISIPKDALYDTLYFKYSKSATVAGSYSDVHHVHEKYTPVNTYYSVSIKATKEIPEKYQDKALIATYNDKGRIISLGGKYMNGFVTAETRDFGKFFIMLDTISPVIRPVNISKGANLANAKKIQFNISDSFSDILFYNGYIDGKWVLFEYEPKSDLITYHIDNHISKGRNHILKIEITDNMNNISTYETEFYY